MNCLVKYLACLSLSVPVVAQPQSVVLGDATVVRTSPEEFERIGGVRELRDGSVLVADVGANRVVRLDAELKTGGDVTRSGRGPGETQAVSALFAFRADSSIVRDDVGARAVYLAGARPARTVGRQDGVAIQPDEIIGADTLGSLMGFARRRTARSEVNGRVMQDSLVLLLWNERSAKAESLLTLRGEMRRAVRLSAPELSAPVMQIVRNPLDSEDQALLFADGWIAYAFVSPYRVTWRSPSGAVVRGPQLAQDVVAVDEGIRRAATERESRVTGRPGVDPTAFPDWPSYLPAFLPNALVSAPDGKLLIRRAERAMNDIHYDMVDRQGRAVGTVTVPAACRIVGSGKSYVYVVSTDSDGIERLSQHRWRPLP